MHCPQCGRPAARSTRMIPGEVVYGCRAGERWTVERSDIWLSDGPGLLDQLRRLAETGTNTIRGGGI